MQALSLLNIRMVVQLGRDRDLGGGQPWITARCWFPARPGPAEHVVERAVPFRGAVGILVTAWPGVAC
jgi:hypothetical protein